MPETLVPLCATTEVAENTVKLVEAGGRTLAVYNIDGTFYATDDECTHGAASLSDGILDGDVIECTMHFGAFDVKTGKPVQEPCSIALRTYKVVVQDDQVFVDLQKSAGE
jgi:nitrite reductase/ring-hydroxylating ferredoxin subunit